MCDEHVGLHLALQLPGFQRISGKIHAVRVVPEVGAEVRTWTHPYGFDVPVSSWFDADQTVTLHRDPVEEIPRG